MSIDAFCQVHYIAELHPVIPRGTDPATRLGAGPPGLGGLPETTIQVGIFPPTHIGGSMIPNHPELVPDVVALWRHRQAAKAWASGGDVDVVHDTAIDAPVEAYPEAGVWLIYRARYYERFYSTSAIAWFAAQVRRDIDGEGGIIQTTHAIPDPPGR
jgi:hypothetical protein